MVVTVVNVGAGGRDEVVMFEWEWVLVVLDDAIR